MKADILYNISKKIGLQIKKLREEKNMTQQDLADICNFDKSDMSKIESGKANPTLRTFIIISQALEANISELFLFDDK